MIPVEGYKNLYRDENSNAIINCNDSEYNDYMFLKNEKLNEGKELEDLKNQIEELKLTISKLLSN